MYRVYKPAYFIAAVAIASSAVSACVKSEDGNATTAERSSQPATETTGIRNPQSERSAAAINLLSAVAEARAALSQNNKGRAIAAVDTAQNALGRTGGEQLVPIYTELSQQAVLGPIEAAKKQPEASTSAESATEGNTPSRSTNAAAPVAVKAVTRGYSRVLLDTSVASKMLNSARAALTRNDLPAADNNLKMLEQSVVLQTSAARMPLVRARETLYLASVAVNRGDWREVKANLTAAARGLDDYSHVAPAADVADVGLVQRQIADYASAVEDTHVDAASRINQWWVQVANLSD